MTTPLYPTFEKRIREAAHLLFKKQVEPWAFLSTGHPMRVTKFDGSAISYQNVGFEGSPNNVFWGRYIEPFLEDLSVKEIAAAAAAARERGVDGPKLLGEVEGLLLSYSRKTLNEMAKIDRRLRGKGYPDSVPLRSVDREYGLVEQFIQMHVRAEIEMWKPRPWYDLWYEQNRFWVWLIGALLTAAGIAATLL